MATTKSEDLSKQTEKAIDARISVARKVEVLEVYEDLMRTIWQRIQPTLGRITVMAIVERALVITRNSYPMLADIRVTADGVVFDELRTRVGEHQRGLLRDALKEFVTNVIDILATLTGDIIVRQLIREIEGKGS